jgi:hypothetical protein
VVRDVGGAEVAFDDDFATAVRLFCSQKHMDRQLGGGPSASAWPEYAMFSEGETLDNDADNSPVTAQEQSGDGGDNQDNADDDDQPAAAVDDAWMAAFEADEDTAQWATFQARVSGKKQDQVLRYCDGGGGPLWAVASGSLPAGAAPLPPPCARCGGARRYEMQLMPQPLPTTTTRTAATARQRPSD